VIFIVYLKENHIYIKEDIAIICKFPGYIIHNVSIKILEKEEEDHLKRSYDK